jgi:hypothetical protein
MLAEEILETYPNQAGIRFILDLIRHGRSLLALKNSPPTNQAAKADSDIDRIFSQGFGRYKFGMTTGQINAVLDHPFSTIDPSKLPRAAEYWTGEVRYFWIPISALSEFRQIYDPATVCLDDRMDYVVFMFHEDSLLRLSYRLYGPLHDGKCGNRRAVFPKLAEQYHLPLLGTPKQWRLHWETEHASVVGTTYDLGPMLDIIER